jgi:MFS superfamily sulfate permease-like transporter
MGGRSGHKSARWWLICLHSVARRFCRRTFPWLQWLPTYSAKNDLIRDVVAGLTVGVMAVPQAMSYATVAGTQPRLFAGVLVHAAFR